MYKENNIDGFQWEVDFETTLGLDSGEEKVFGPLANTQNRETSWPRNTSPLSSEDVDKIWRKKNIRWKQEQQPTGLWHI